MRNVSLLVGMQIEGDTSIRLDTSILLQCQIEMNGTSHLIAKHEKVLISHI